MDYRYNSSTNGAVIRRQRLLITLGPSRLLGVQNRDLGARSIRRNRGWNRRNRRPNTAGRFQRQSVDLDTIVQHSHICFAGADSNFSNYPFFYAPKAGHLGASLRPSGPFRVDRGSIGVDRGSIGVDRGSIGVDRTSIEARSGSIGPRLGSIGLDRGPIEPDRGRSRLDWGEIPI